LFRPIDVVPALSKALAVPLRPRGLVVSSNGKPVAARIYGILGDTAYSLYSATIDEALPLRAGYRMHWDILNEIRGKAQWYDLGISSDDQGMRSFKEGLIGKRGKLVIVPSEFDYADGFRTRLALRVLHGLRGARRLYMKLRQSLIR
jgi:lipid II:glycine glycyltransferase (peptidoglycan interpeptide bridge formation enzyme)